MDLVSYYKDRNIRARIIEFLGGKSLDSATCMFIAQCDAEDERGWDMRSPQELEYFLSGARYFQVTLGQKLAYRSP